MLFHLPIIRGVIDRRILVNFTVDPAVAAKLLPRPFRPKLVNGFAVAGICLIRLKQIRPRGWPAILGISSENAAHRIAVEWACLFRGAIPTQYSTPGLAGGCFPAGIITPLSKFGRPEIGFRFPSKPPTGLCACSSAHRSHNDSHPLLSLGRSKRRPHFSQPVRWDIRQPTRWIRTKVWNSGASNGRSSRSRWTRSSPVSSNTSNGWRPARFSSTALC